MEPKTIALLVEISVPHSIISSLELPSAQQLALLVNILMPVIPTLVRLVTLTVSVVQ